MLITLFIQADSLHPIHGKFTTIKEYAYKISSQYLDILYSY